LGEYRQRIICFATGIAQSCRICVGASAPCCGGHAFCFQTDRRLGSADFNIPLTAKVLRVASARAFDGVLAEREIPGLRLR
jgi:hypothetical protein